MNWIKMTDELPTHSEALFFTWGTGRQYCMGAVDDSTDGREPEVRTCTIGVRPLSQFSHWARQTHIAPCKLNEVVV